jgi:hypothetical protein
VPIIPVAVGAAVAAIGIALAVVFLAGSGGDDDDTPGAGGETPAATATAGQAAGGGATPTRTPTAGQAAGGGTPTRPAATQRPATPTNAPPAPTFTPVPPTPTPTATPQGGWARINGITAVGGVYQIAFETQGFTYSLPGIHVHFFFDTVPVAQAGSPGGGPWAVYGGPSPFTGYRVSDKPGAARQMCILVANPDHSIRPGTGNCVALP